MTPSSIDSYTKFQLMKTIYTLAQKVWLGMGAQVHTGTILLLCILVLSVFYIYVLYIFNVVL